MFNNAYQNLELKIDLLSGGTIAGLKEKIKSVLGNKILILCGLKLDGVDKLPAVCEPNIYVTQTEEPDDWDEEEDGEFVPEDVYHLEASNIYGYDIAIEDDTITCAKTVIVSVSDIEAGTIENAKPIYYHPILIDGTLAVGDLVGAERVIFSVIILDNNPEAYTTSNIMSKLLEFSRINPFICCDIKLLSDAILKPISVARSYEQLRIIGFDDAGVLHTEGSNVIRLDNMTVNYCFDNVNKLN